MTADMKRQQHLQGESDYQQLRPCAVLSSSNN
jgi:hypothetical protein